MFFRKDRPQREGRCCAHPVIKTAPEGSTPPAPPAGGGLRNPDVAASALLAKGKSLLPAIPIGRARVMEYFQHLYKLAQTSSTLAGLNV